MKHLSEVPKLTNTEVLDGLVERFTEIENRVKNPSLKIIRKVEPTDDEFKGVQSSIKEIVQQNFPKERGSNHLITTIQGLYIVPENENEEKKTLLISRYLHRAWGLNDQIESVIKSQVSGISAFFSDDPKVQRVVFNSEFDPTGSLEGLNDHVTGFEICPLDWGRDCFSNRSYGYGNNDTPSDAILSFLDDGDWFRFARYELGSDDDNRYWDILTDVLDVDENIIEIDDYKTSDQLINLIEPSVLFANLSEVNRKLDAVNSQIDEYMDAVSITYSTFREMFPEIDAVLENQLIKDEEVELRKSQLQRKTMNVDMTFNMDIELDSLGDLEDIKKTIMERVQKQLGMNVKFGLSSFGTEEFMRVKNEKFTGLEVTSEMKEVA